MGRLLKPGGSLMALTMVLVSALCANSEETSRQVVENISHADQPSKITISVSGKELLDALQTTLEPLRQVGLVVTTEEDSVILTSDTMSEELTEFLNKARMLMRDHPGRILIVHKDWRKQLHKDLEQRVRALGFAGLQPTDPRGLGGGYAGFRGYGRGLDIIVKTPFTVNGYAYAEEDREHAVELERQCHDLAVQYMSSNDEAKRVELEKELKDNLNQLFDLKLKGFKEKITSIERELDGLRTQLDERQNNKDLIVTGRFKELVGEHDHLQW